MQNFGVREICNVVLKTKANTIIGNKKFYKDEPVIYFDTLKTSSLEGAATTVYAEGGRGNSRLMSWDGERTMTFTMEDALISPEGFMILSGAGLIEADEDHKLKQHVIETLDRDDIEGKGTQEVTIEVEKEVFLGAEDDTDNYAYIMFVDEDGNMSEPFLPSKDASEGKKLVIAAGDAYTPTDIETYGLKGKLDHVIVDYYTERSSGVRQINIEPGKFSGNFYLEADTLFRDINGVDHAAEFIIPNCRVQSNFTFSMAATGDPSTFTFTMDAFPDYTRFDRSKKVLAALQIVDADSDEDTGVRVQTAAFGK